LLPEEIIKKILEIRGIASEEGVREFLSDKPMLTHDPLLMPGMAEGVEFLLGALSKGKRICVYGDYDVDGVCGTALTVLFLREAVRMLDSASEITYYVPSRVGEGYGLHEEAIKTIKDEGAEVIVTVDCGSVGAGEVAYAREIGLDILITDHHDPDPLVMPECVFINPKEGAGTGGYPYKQLAGAGVAFKLCSALLTRMGEANRSILNDLIDLVCVATIADVMPLTDENRTFVKYGLSKLRKGSRPAFSELLAVSGIDKANLTARSVAFGIAPRLNALGRLGTASEAIEFFITDDGNRIKEIAERMDRLNSERRLIQDMCFRECMDLVESGAGFLLLKPACSHEGVAGIVAGKVREATGKPCAVLTETQEDKGSLKGSVRSRGRLDVISLLRKHGGLFERLGGHAAAAGFTIKEKNLELLREALTADIAHMLEDDPDLLTERKDVELEVGAGDVTEELAEAIEKLAPFGEGNPRPVLALNMPAESISGLRSMGQDGKHLRFTAGGIMCVFFGGAGTAIPGTGTIRIAGCPEMNEWNGNRNIQFAVEHIDVLQ